MEVGSGRCEETLEGRDRLPDTQEGSSFPRASALFFLRGAWNVLREEHELPGSLMALPTGAALTRLTSP